jgi:hypothetical protein
MMGQSNADRAAADAKSTMGSSSSDTSGVPRVSSRAHFRGFETGEKRKKIKKKPENKINELTTYESGKPP